MSKENTNDSLKRLEKLKQATIMNYLEVVNLDTIMDFYDSMVEHLFRGDLDSSFLSKSLVGLDKEEKSEIFQLARKYKDLCFYMGDAQYWSDSIEGVYLTDLDLVCMKLFDNYDFLLGLAKDGGESALKQLVAFQDGSMPLSGSVVDFLRNSFENDDALKDIIIEMSKTDGEYAGLSDKQKEILCSFPKGILFEEKHNATFYVPRRDIIRKIQEEYFGTTIEDVSDFSSLVSLFSDDDEFENAIVDIYYDQQKENEAFSK